MSSDPPFRALLSSDRFVISCGTVPLDLRHRKILLIREAYTKEIFLPKGRKNENECLRTAALRETYEETGYPATILPLKLPTHATNRTRDEEHTEPIAITQRVTKGVLKIIFWYAASVDFRAFPDLGTQQEGENFESLWTDCRHGVTALTFADDREVARLAVNAAFGLDLSAEQSN
jgi:ADP-ribose pyrophosphatase YjhB (NUDIX family)